MATGYRPELTVVPGEKIIETTGAISSAPAILPKGLAYNITESSDWCGDLKAKTKYRSVTTAG